MLKQKPLSWMAAGALTAATVFAAVPATAASTHQRSCLRYSYSLDRWVNVCRTYSSRDAAPPLDAPHPFFYPYHYVPPYGSNGPYYGYEPYNGYQSALGIWF